MPSLGSYQNIREKEFQGPYEVKKCPARNKNLVEIPAPKHNTVILNPRK